MRVISWNIADRAKAWQTLERLEPSIALLQEALPPPRDVAVDVWSESLDPSWRARVRGLSPHGAAIACFDPTIKARRVDVVDPSDAAPGDITISHPGQFAVAEIIGADATMNLVSLYGIWEKQPGVGIYSEATLHRAISDLTPLLQAKTPLLIAGDLNIFRGYTLDGEKTWLARYDTVFDRFSAYDVEVAGPFREEGPLEGCRCDQPGCRHVRTYRHQYKETSRPDQLDFVLANPGMRERIRSCKVIATPETWAVSDHAPIATEIEA